MPMQTLKSANTSLSLTEVGSPATRVPPISSALVMIPRIRWFGRIQNSRYRLTGISCGEEINIWGTECSSCLARRACGSSEVEQAKRGLVGGDIFLHWTLRRNF